MDIAVRRRIEGRGGMTRRPNHAQREHWSPYLSVLMFLVDPKGNLPFYNEPAETVLGRRFDADARIRRFRLQLPPPIPRIDILRLHMDHTQGLGFGIPWATTDGNQEGFP
jgi:hypothetical protein